MDKHLVNLVKQTERYTKMLAENMKSGGTKGNDFKDKVDDKISNANTKNQKMNNSLDTRKNLIVDNSYSDDNLDGMDYDDDNDDAFEAEDEEEEDEIAMMEEEALLKLAREEGDVDDEINQLEKDKDIPIEQLRAMYSHLGDLDDDDDEKEEEVLDQMACE